MVQVFQLSKEELKEAIRECVEEALAGVTSAPKPDKARVKDIDEAAELLGVSKPTIYRLVKEARERTAVAQSRKRAGVSMILCLGKGVNRDGSPCGVEQARYPAPGPARAGCRKPLRFSIKSPVDPTTGF